ERRVEDKRHEIGKSIQMGARIYDGIHLVNEVGAAVGPIARQSGLGREDGGIFNDALRVSVDVTSREGPVARQLLLKTKRVFVSEPELSSGRKALLGAY